MTSTGSQNLIARGSSIAALVVLVLLVSGVGTASAATAEEEAQGAKVLRELEAGVVECGDLDGEQFEHVGDYAMGRMAGSTARHEAMDETMTQMMGATAEREMHEVMGRRFSGCGGGKLPAGFGRMMGAFGALGTMGGGMMGGPGEGGNFYGGPGSMMGGGHWGEPGGDGGSDEPSTAALIALIAVFIAALAAVFLWLSRRRPRGPLDTLKRRLAAGELTSAEYEERRRLLSGS
jgi:hypothetical protein